MKTTRDTKKRKPALGRPAPPVDGLTVGWMMTLTTAILCELSAVGTRMYVHWIDPEARLLSLLSAMLLFAAAVVGIVLLVLTPIIVYRKQSHPPRGVVVLAYVAGIVPWIGMFLQAQG